MMFRSPRFKSIILILMFILITGAAHSQTNIPRTMYVLNGSAETVSKMNMESNTIVQNILNTGQLPNQIAVYDQMIYVVNSGTDDITIIDPENDQQVFNTIALDPGNNPWAIGFPGTNKAYVTNFLDHSVSVVNLETGAVQKRIEVGIGPEGILVHENHAFVANTGFTGYGQPYAQASVSIIDSRTDSVTHTLPVPANAQDLAVDPLGRIHVVCTGDFGSIPGQVVIIDLDTGLSMDTPAVVDTLSIGGTPSDIVITPNGKGYCMAWGDGVNGFLYSYDAFADTVMRGAGDPIRIGPNVWHIVYDSVEDVLWIPYMSEWGGDGFVQRFDTVTDSVVWNSGVLGNGTQDIAILEPILSCCPTTDAGPESCILYPNYPNPFNPETLIRYAVEHRQTVKLTVYNSRGQKIRTLVDRVEDAGIHEIAWDGTDMDGNQVPNGVYFYCLQHTTFNHVRKMTLLK